LRNQLVKTQAGETGHPQVARGRVIRKAIPLIPCELLRIAGLNHNHSVFPSAVLEWRISPNSVYDA
jgi:hypothetical protein